MSTIDRDIVADLHDALQQQIGPDRFDVWIRNQVTFEVRPQQLIIAGRDTFSLDQIRRRFGRLIQSLIGEQFGPSHEINWCTHDELKQADSPSSSSAHESQTDSNRLPTSRSANASLAADLRATPQHPSPSNEGTKASHDLAQDCRSATGGIIPRRSAHAASVTPPIPAGSAQNAKRIERPSFDQFVVDESTRLAYSAAQHIPARLGDVSPLLFFGPNGVGKSHLLQAIYREVRERRRHRSLLITSEQFTSGFLEALHGHGLPNFRRKYRNIDLLLIDDIQFFVGKRATLVELFYTIDALVQEGKQIVLASDRPPHELTGVGSEIIARLSAGLTCAMDYPIGGKRIQLVAQLAELRKVVLRQDVLQLIADELPGDARHIKGALNRLALIQASQPHEISADYAARELADLFRSNARPLAIDDIERVVCDVFGVEGKLLRSDRKSKSVSQPRMLAMWLARKHTRAAYSEIGDYFGGRSHSTVISAANKVQGWVGTNADIQIACGASSVNDAIRRIETALRAV